MQPIDNKGKKIIDLRSAKGMFQSSFDSLSSCGIFSTSSPTSVQRNVFFYPVLEFVEKKYSPIRNYKFFPITLSLSITLNSKACFFIKNHVHRSNDTRVIVNLMSGNYYEKCWSSKCRHQRNDKGKVF